MYRTNTNVMIFLTTFYYYDRQNVKCLKSLCGWFHQNRDNYTKSHRYKLLPKMR